MILEWYWIVLLTVLGMQVIGCIILAVSAICDLDEENMILMLCPTWVVVWVLSYPIRAMLEYDRDAGIRRLGISRIAYLFGSRPYYKKEKK